MKELIWSSRRRSTLLHDVRGLSTVEYVIILVLVVAVGIGGWQLFGQQVKCALGLATDEIGGAIGGGTVGQGVCARGGPSSPGSGSGGTVTPTPPDPGGGAAPPAEKKKKRATGS